MKFWRAFLSRFFKTKRPFKLTGPGWVFILYTIGVGAGAINTGNNLLYLVFGVFLGLLLASGFLSDLSLCGVEVDYTFPHAGQAGQPISIFLSLSNTKRRIPSVSVIVTLDGELNGARVQLKRHVPLVSARANIQTRFDWAPPARGWFQLQNVRLSTRYPFGLLEKWWRLRLEKITEEGFFVTPATQPVDIRRVLFESAGEEKEHEHSDRGDGTTLLGLKSYVTGDNPRRIHWKASAKRAPVFAGESTWLVREMNREQKEEVVFVCPDPSQVSSMKEDEAEKLVEFLASALESSRQSGFEPRIILSERIILDETAFLALWNPHKNPDDRLQKYLTEAPLLAAARSIDLLGAFHVADAR